MGGYYPGDGPYLQLSADYGNNWNSLPGSQATVTDLAINSDGTMLVKVETTLISTSNDYGNTWNATAVPPAAWADIAVSTSGQFLTAVADNGLIFTSSDYGQRWADRSVAGLENFSSVALSSSGQLQTALSPSGTLYVSDTFGFTWSSIALSGSNVVAHAMSANGSYIAYVSTNGTAYISSTSGQAWEAVSLTACLAGHTPASITMSDTGLIQVVMSTQGGCLSTNFGQSFQTLSLPTLPPSPCTSIAYNTPMAMSSSGMLMLCALTCYDNPSDDRHQPEVFGGWFASQSASSSWGAFGFLGSTDVLTVAISRNMGP